MEITGKIKKIFATQEVTASFKKREFVVTTLEQYPQDILLEFTQDKCDLLNSSKEGDEVVVAINIRGREWINPQGQAKYFNTIQAWRINLVTQAPTQTPQAGPTESFNQSKADDDDLPF